MYCPQISNPISERGISSDCEIAAGSHIPDSIAAPRLTQKGEYSSLRADVPARWRVQLGIPRRGGSILFPCVCGHRTLICETGRTRRKIRQFGRKQLTWQTASYDCTQCSVPFQARPRVSWRGCAASLKLVPLPTRKRFLAHAARHLLNAQSAIDSRALCRALQRDAAFAAAGTRKDYSESTRTRG